MPECSVGRLNVRIPQQIRELIVCRGIFQVGSSTSSDMRGQNAADTDAICNDEPLIVERQWAHKGDPEARWIGVVIHALAQQLVHLPFLRARITDDPELRTVRIGRLTADQKAVYIYRGWTQRIGERGSQLRHLLPVEDVDVGISREQLGVDSEEEAARLELVVFDRAIDRLQNVVANREDAIANHVSLLLRDDAAQLDSLTEVGDRLHAIIATRDRRRDEARRWWLERDIADFELLDELVGLALERNRNGIGRVELPLRVVIHVHVHSLGDYTGGSESILEIESGLEGGTTGVRGQEVADSLAAVGFVLLVSELQPGVDLNAEVGVVAKQLFILDRLAGLALLGVFGGKRLRPACGKILGGDLSPDRFQNRTTVQLEGCSSGRLDLGFGFAVQCGVRASLDGGKLKRESILPDAYAEP